MGRTLDNAMLNMGTKDIATGNPNASQHLSNSE
jgi:hypothetical protein